MNQRGAALPMALIALAILSSLMIAFAALSSTEPAIANNHMMSARARGFAESGVERVIWAINNTGVSGLADPLPNPPPAPYNGTVVVAEQGAGGSTLGSYKVTALPDAADPNLVHITSVGSVFVPGNPNARAIKKIQVDVMRLKFGNPAGTPPCALCLGGETPPSQQSSLQVGGSATVNANNTTGSNPATYCSGQVPTDAILSTGVVSTNGHPDITAPPSGNDIRQGVPLSSFSAFTLSNADMVVLKAIAKIRGTYYQGNQNWTSPPPDGLVFVDTPSGNPLTSTSPSSDKITVDMHGNWSAGWKGMMIIAGSAEISGNMQLSGLIYIQNDVKYTGTGTGKISGAIVAQNRADAVASQVDSEQIGNGKISYNCPNIRDGGGSVNNNWFPKPGTYKEIAGT